MKGDARPLVILSRVALIVAAIDLATKAIASALWTEAPLHIMPLLSLSVVHNTTGAFGWSAGAYTWQLNLALTLCAVIFVIPVARDLAKIDAGAPRALGLITGGALGNLLSMIAPPAGVTDFISVHWSPGHGVVLNLADVAAYAGLVMILRTGFLIVAALRKQYARGSRVRIGSAYMQKAKADLVVRPHREEIVKDWGVVDLGIVRADRAPGRDGPIPRPLGASGEHERVRLVDSVPTPQD